MKSTITIPGTPDRSPKRGDCPIKTDRVSELADTLAEVWQEHAARSRDDSELDRALQCMVRARAIASYYRGGPRP